MNHRVTLVCCAVTLFVSVPVNVWADGMSSPWLSPGGQSSKSLVQFPPVWDKLLSAHDTGDACNSSRFTCVLSSQAVRDSETGLVWEKSPDFVNYRPWGSALQTCANRITGGRMGWRLPSVHELSSLVAPSVADPGPRLPVGHPFTNVQSAFYWTASGNANDSATAWGVNFREGTVAGEGKLSQHLAWCVRSAGPIDSY